MFDKSIHLLCFARSYQLQISTNLDFSGPIVSVAYQTQAFYVWSQAAANRTYFYRVKTVNEAGASEWSVGSFNTVPSFITLAFPNGGEALQRGNRYFIRWNGNLAENVNIELYKSGVLTGTIATNVSDNGAFNWQPGFDLLPASDYVVKITSVTNAQLAALSQSNFSIIDPPSIAVSSIALSQDGQVRFNVNAPGAAQVSVFGSSDLSSWQLLQTLSVSGGSAQFVGAGSANSQGLFYRLRVP